MHNRRTRRSEIKCMILLSVALLFSIFAMTQKNFDILALVAVGLFAMAYLLFGVFMEYYHSLQPIEIEMVVIHTSDMCTICLEPCLNGVQLPCTHTFHKQCIQKWLTVNQSCPNCRITV